MFSNSLTYASDALNVSEAALRLLASILLGLPIALFHRHVLYGKSPFNQHLYFTTCGILMCYWNYGSNTYHSAVALCVTYLILKFLHGTTLSVLLTFLFNMSYLLYGYYTTATTDYDIKWTMPQCVLTLRLIGLAFNLCDGVQPQEKLSASQKQVALKERPTFWQLSAYTYFPGSFLVGPQFSMKRYLDYVHGNLIPNKSAKGEVELPDSIGPGISRLLVGFVYVMMHYLGVMYMSDHYLLSSEFEKQPFLKRLLFIGFWGHVNLYKYISCWLFTEGICTVFGLTYNGKDENDRPLWDGCTNVNLSTIETATRFNHYIMAFNINTNHWCAEYIYKRLKFLGSKLYSQFGTLLFLAIWHGLHSGYYVCFLMEFIIMYAEKDVTDILKRYEKLQSLPKKHLVLRILFSILTWIYTFVFMGYSLVPFILLSYPRYHQVYSSVYYCGHIIYLTYPAISILLKTFVIKKRSKKVD